MTEVFDAGGRRLRLVGDGHSGGEGTVYPIEGQRRVCKLYHPGRLTDEVARKLDVMLRTRPADDGNVAWVDGLVRDRSRRLVGFTMPAVQTGVFRQAHAFYDPSDRVAAFGGGFTWRHLLGAAHNLAVAVASVHAAGHRVGDLRETNILVAPTALVTLIDCDSFQVRDPRSGQVYPCRVATGDYLAPELHGVDFRGAAPDRLASDLFALAVLAFRFLMLGAHPYQARGLDDAPTTEAKIRRGVFAYVDAPRGVTPPPYAPPFSVVPAALRTLFTRAFVDGHSDPDARPDAREWADALGAAALKTCPANPNHAFSGRACPWCRMTPDPFPAPVAVVSQTALTPPADGPPEAARREALRSHVRVALADDSLKAVRKVGADLGLRARQIDTIVDAEARSRPKSRVQAQPPTQRSLPSWRDREVRASAKAAAPIVALAALAGALAPVLVPLAVVLIALPLFVTLGQALSDTGTWRARLLAPARFGLNLHRSIARSGALLVPATMGAVAVWQSGPYAPIVLRIVGAALTAVIALDTIVRLPGSSDPMALPAMVARDTLRQHLVGASGRARRPVYVFAGVTALAATAIARGTLVSWPLS